MVNALTLMFGIKICTFSGEGEMEKGTGDYNLLESYESE
jgi:hypothetical protein